jgi:cholesterol transport system auxiliary component
MRTAAVIAAAGLMLATGCVSVLPEAGPAPHVYRLAGGRATLGAASAGLPAGAGGLALTIADVLAPRALSGDRIAVITEDGRISYAAGARWNEQTPEIVQERMLAAFEDDPRASVVTRPEDGVATPYEVRIELMSFEADYANGDDAAPQARVEARAKLIDRRTRALVASRRFEIVRPTTENRIGPIVAALDDAMSTLSGEIVNWAVAAAAEPERSEPPGPQPSDSAASSSR